MDSTETVTEAIGLLMDGPQLFWKESLYSIEIETIKRTREQITCVAHSLVDSTA